MKDKDDLLSPISLPEITQAFSIKRRATMNRIKISLQTIPLLSQNKTKATSKLSSKSDDFDDPESNLSNSTISDHHHS